MNNVFSICGLAGVLNAQRELIIAFFGYNAVQTVFTFHFMLDMLVDSRAWDLVGSYRGSGGQGNVPHDLGKGSTEVLLCGKHDTSPWQLIVSCATT